VALRYDRSGQTDLHGYAASMAAYAVLVGLALGVGRLTGQRLPERASTSDLVLGGLATHKLSRLLARGSVTSPLRAPFTEHDGPAGAAELNDRARGSSGVRHTVGELLTCPFCVSVWLGTGYVTVLTLSPRVARLGAATFSVVAISDWLHLGYEALRKRAA
jgi:hypothetical protein